MPQGSRWEDTRLLDVVTEGKLEREILEWVQDFHGQSLGNAHRNGWLPCKRVHDKVIRGEKCKDSENWGIWKRHLLGDSCHGL